MNKEELEKQTMEWKNNYILKLEKEKLGLKDYCDKYTKTILSLRHNVVDLEKENAELKKRVDNLYNSDCWASDQLTKAKELLKQFLEAKNGEDTYKAEWEAEQFLKDCDIDNAIQQANKGLDFDKIADEMEQDLKDSEVEK